MDSERPQPRGNSVLLLKKFDDVVHFFFMQGLRKEFVGQQLGFLLQLLSQSQHSFPCAKCDAEQDDVIALVHHGLL